MTTEIPDNNLQDEHLSLGLQHLRPRTMVFIDGSNLFKTCNDRNVRYDPVGLSHHIASGYQLQRVYFYSSIPPLNNDADRQRHSGQITFYNRLNREPLFRVKLLTLKVHPETGRREEKGVDLAVGTDMLDLAHRDAYDVGILVAGDRDYADVVRRIKGLGKQVIQAWFQRYGGSEVLRATVDDLIKFEDVMTESTSMGENARYQPTHDEQVPTDRLSVDEYL